MIVGCLLYWIYSDSLFTRCYSCYSRNCEYWKEQSRHGVVVYPVHDNQLGEIGFTCTSSSCRNSEVRGGMPLLHGGGAVLDEIEDFVREKIREKARENRGGR